VSHRGKMEGRGWSSPLKGSSSSVMLHSVGGDQWDGMGACHAAHSSMRHEVERRQSYEPMDWE